MKLVLPDLLARVQVRYPEIPILFLETRALAEEWTFRYLGAALADHLDALEASGAIDREPPLLAAERASVYKSRRERPE